MGGSAEEELIPAQRKAGLPWRHTLGNGGRARASRTRLHRPLANYAQLDMPGFITRAVNAEANANYNAKIRQTIESQRQSIANPADGLEHPEQRDDDCWRSRWCRASSFFRGRATTFAASMREDYLPAYKKAGVKDYWVFTTNQGGPGGERVLVRPIAKYGPTWTSPGLLVQAGLSQEQQDKIGARRNATLANGARTEVYRFIPELSYGSPGQVRQTN